MGNVACCMEPKFNHRHLSVDIQISTWTQLPNLYDYTATDHKTQSVFSTSQDTIFIKYQDSWRSLTSLKQLDKLKRDNIDCYFDLSRQHSSFSMFNNATTSHPLSPLTSWEVIEPRDRLRVGDVFKLGRLRFQFLDMVVTPIQQQENEEIETLNSCKICYEKTASVVNPLLSPCACTGTLKYIHLECLREWSKNRCKVVSSDAVVEIPVAQNLCELCHQPYPSVHVHNGVNYSTLYDSNIVKPPYIQLSLLQKSNNSIQLTYIISFGNKGVIKIGRGSTCQIQIKDDISISRVHSQLHFEDGKIYLQNCSSKFGTLKMVKEPMCIINCPIIKKFQMGNNLIEVQMRYSPEAKLEEEEEVNEARSIRQSLARSEVSLHRAPMVWSQQPLMFNSAQLGL